MSEGNQYQERKIINWPEYNQALVNRGSITFWFDRDIEKVWFHKKTGPTGRGLDKTFSDAALQACLMLRMHYKLTLRSMEGFVNSLFALLGLALSCPDYTLFSKGRGRQLQVAIARRLPKGPVDIVVDSTGLKVYGEGEWKVRKHGVSKRRTWRKLHLGINPDNHDIVMVELTKETVSDCEVFPDLMEQLGDQPIGQVSGDGAYDNHPCYDAILERGGTPVIPPRKDAVEWEADHPRTQAVKACKTAEGRKDWKRQSGYHRRSLSETAMYRYKQLIGPMLRARAFATQQVEVHAAVAVLNRINTLGMPKRA
ncbi:MAG: IS5 family transposase [Planctomycetes bacterium]|nr:IS5 family transposase [Planctomycetota bacterium]